MIAIGAGIAALACIGAGMMKNYQNTQCINYIKRSVFEMARFTLPRVVSGFFF